MSRLYCFALAAVLAAAPAAAQDWQLVWADEFDVDGAPDATKWGYDLGAGGWGNQELQHYTDRPENARVAGGALTIEARREAFAGSDYTSARLVTRGLAAWTYGRIEARIDLPEGQGIWPAFWMLPTNSPYGGWPAGGEIDIMEFLGHDTDRVYGTLHYGGGELGHRFTGTHFDLASGSFADGYHTYAIEWEPRRIRWYVDGELYQTQVNWSSAGGGYPAPFDSPFHLLLNVAVGGQWPGYPDASTVFPQEMRVDYVRVSQDAEAYPEVALVTPPATVDTGATLALEATASDGGAVAEVAFLQGSGVLGTVSAPPYTLDIAGVADGCYSVSARATDDVGYVTETDPVEVVVGGGCPEGQASPYLIAPAPVPGAIEVEYFDLGGPMVGFRDLGADNSGSGIRRDEGVDIDPSSDNGGGYDVVDLVAREWMDYSVDIAQAGTYRITARAASATGATVRLALDGEDLVGDGTIAPTGGLSRYATVVLGQATLPAGRHTLRFEARSAGFVLNRLNLGFVGGTDREETQSGELGLRVAPNPTAGRVSVGIHLPAAGPFDLAVYDVTGRRVLEVGSGTAVAGHRTVGADLSGLATGVYAVVLDGPGGRRARVVTLTK